ncbi:MAG: hypothetical protein QW767_06325 [Thermoprotei archaeon]
MSEDQHRYYLVEHRVNRALNEEKPVTVRLKTTFYGLGNIARSVSEPAEQGQEVALPRWLARTLVRKGHATYVSQQPSIKQRLARSIWQEEQTTSIPKLPENFYTEVADAIDEAEAAGDQGSAGIRSKLQDFLRIRVKKIRRYAETKSQFDFIENLTPEERAWLFGYRRSFIAWVEGNWLKENLEIRLEARLGKRD